MKANGELFIRGRKKEMIVTPEGLNVFPEDVERVLKQQPGVRDSAVIGTDRVHAVLILDPGADADEIVRRANARLADYQRVRSVFDLAGRRIPAHRRNRETEAPRNRRRNAAAAPSSAAGSDVPLENLTSLERVERMVALGLG